MVCVPHGFSPVALPKGKSACTSGLVSAVEFEGILFDRFDSAVFGARFRESAPLGILSRVLPAHGAMMELRRWIPSKLKDNIESNAIVQYTPRRRPEKRLEAITLNGNFD
jgi:hypothetical protein